MKKRTLHLSTLTIIVVSLTLIAAVIATAFSFVTIYNQALLQNAATASTQAVSQASVTISNYLDAQKDQLRNLCQQLNGCPSAGRADDLISLTAELQEDIETVMIYREDGTLLTHSASAATLKKDRSRNLSYDSALFAKASGYAVSLPHVQTLFTESYPWVVTMVHKESLPLYGGDVYVTIDFRFSEIARYVDAIGIGEHGYCYILAAGGHAVYHPQQQMVFSGIKSEDFAAVDALSNGTHRDGDHLFTLHSISGTDWRTVGVSYTNELTASKDQAILHVVLLSLVCCAAVALLVVFLYFRIVTRPVRALVKAMQDFEKDVTGYRYHATSTNVREIQILSDSFAHMAAMTAELTERIRREEITLRKTELKALQAQINPHFLYNTLDSIQWMCEKERSEDAVKMVGALAKLFRISISHGNELIPVRDELKHVESYLIIQSYRYKNQFSYRFVTDESILDCLMNKITLQPLVENAIYHGIERMVDEGVITVTAKPSPDGNLLFTVEDNGVGMTKAQCAEILRKERTNSSGIGIKNVNDRIRIYFGDRFGLTVESELDVGTKITVLLPQLRKEPDNEV